MTKAGTTKDPGITRIGVVGCGYVADLYAQTLSAHPELVVQGLYDLNPERLAAHASCHNRLRYDSLDYMLADPAVELVVNLTNPEAHHAVSHAALLAGKHVYSEKPLGVDLSEAKALMALAEEKGLLLGSAPCNHLAEATEALAELIRNQALGSVCSVHAQMDDGMLPGLDFEHWRSISGAPWPYEDEFRMGVTLEHAGYSLVPLVYLFGPVRKVIAYAANRVPDKGARLGVDPAVTRDDMSWAILEFDRGVVARLTTSVLAPIDRSIRIIGTEAVATLADVWDYRTQVRIAPTGKTKRHKVFRKIDKLVGQWVPGFMSGGRVTLPEPRFGVRSQGGRRAKRPKGGNAMDFARGPAALAAAIRGEAENPLPADLGLHITEVTLVLREPESHPIPYVVESSPAALPGSPWRPI